MTRFRFLTVFGMMLASITSASLNRTNGQVAAPPSANSPVVTIDQAQQVIQQQHFQLMQMLDQLEPYQPLEKLAGKVQLNGSRTMSDMGHQWASSFILP